ncbi:Sec20-domain-containing protein [Scheffersomyces amazonensis]|uniref:Sec20-domain-containing protein n=1 Tax=Scheffersomyces amazonensis TaxID=1078765 RepID=UPI00315CBA79
MMDEYYNKLDQLTVNVYENFNHLLALNQDEDVVEPKLESNKIIRKINGLLLNYKDYLHIVKNKYNTHDKNEVLKYESYVSKLNTLKNKSKSFHLYSNSLHDELIHKQRIKEYALQEEDNSNKDSINEEDYESARSKLFSGKSKAIKNVTEESIGQQVLSHNKQITSSLQTSKQLLTATVLQSELNIESLDQQTKDLSTLNEDFLRFNDLLNRSKQIVRFIEKQDKADRRRIYMSVGFFILCITWVVYRRVLRTPIRLLFWSFFKIFRIFNWLLVSPNDKILEEGLISLSGTGSEIMSQTTSSIIEQVTNIISSIDIEVEEIQLSTTVLSTTVTEILRDEL